MKIILQVLFSQFDDRWAKVLLGFNTDAQFDIYNYGCLLCCLAMVLKYYGIDIDPLRLNELLKTNNGFELNSGVYDWGSSAKIFPQITSEIVTKTPDPTLVTTEQMGMIKSAIDAGHPVILQIDYNPKTVLADMHFVVAVAYNPQDENDFTIADPLGGRLHSLKDYLGWFRPNVRATIQAFAILEAPLPQVTNTDGVLVANDVFPSLVHGSTEWDKTVARYMATKDPKQTNFDDLVQVIAGFQSAATASNNKLNQQAQDIAGAQQEAKNAEEKLSLAIEQRQDDSKMYLAQIDALKSSGQNIGKIEAIYVGRLDALQSQVNTLLTDKHQLAVENAQLKSQRPLSAVEQYFPTFLKLLRVFIK